MYEATLVLRLDAEEQLVGKERKYARDRGNVSRTGREEKQPVTNWRCSLEF